MRRATALLEAVVILLSTRAFSFYISPATRLAKTARRTTNDVSEQQKIASKLEEYRGSKKWKGLIPAVEEPREWDEGFRAFLLKYGMINHVVQDVFIRGDDDDKDEYGLRGTSRFGDDFERFTKQGLKFSYMNRRREQKIEYDFTDDYHVIGNLVCSPRSFFASEDNWFGYVMLSNDNKELVIVFRGTGTTKEWVENATLIMQQLEGEPKESGLALFFNRENLMVHVGFQSVYVQDSVQKRESPKDTIHRMIEEHKPTLEKVTVVGHSLGGAISQMCAVDLAHSKMLGDIPILCLAWAAPKIGNACLSRWADEMHPKLRILRITCSNDSVPKLPPDWMWTFFNGGYHHMGTEITLSNSHLRAQGLVMDGALGPSHNLQMHLFNIDPTRDPALMNKVGDVIPEEYCCKNNISPSWHSLAWPRTEFDE